MRKARAGDHWRRLGHCELKSDLLEFSGEAVPNMPAVPVGITGPITIITGLNGVGKSSLLQCALLLLKRGQEPEIELSMLRSCDGILKAKVHNGGNLIEVQTTI